MLAKHWEHKCKVSPHNALLSTYMKCHANIIFGVQWNKIFKQLCLNVIISKMLNHAFFIVRNKCYILDTWLTMQKYNCFIYLCSKFSESDKYCTLLSPYCNIFTIFQFPRNAFCILIFLLLGYCARFIGNGKLKWVDVKMQIIIWARHFIHIKCNWSTIISLRIYVLHPGNIKIVYAISFVTLPFHIYCFGFENKNWRCMHTS